MSDLSKTFSLAEVKGLLAAERERCAKVAVKIAIDAKRIANQFPAASVEAHYFGRFDAAHEAAAKIRSLAPQTIGDE